MSVGENTMRAVGRWVLVWTAIGCVFATQLHWYYELPWALSIFWGLADWYLWGLIALLLGKAVHQLEVLRTGARSRVVLYLLAAPFVAALHVVLTMLVGGFGGFPVEMNATEYFHLLYAKKLTLNLITFALIVVIYERLSANKPKQKDLFFARLGDTERLVTAGEIIWGEVCGNYVNLHTESGVWPVRVTLTRLMLRLPRRRFVKTSRSDMVSLEWVREARSGGKGLILSLGNGDEVRVARRLRPSVERALRDYCLPEDES